MSAAPAGRLRPGSAPRIEFVEPGDPQVRRRAEAALIDALAELGIERPIAVLFYREKWPDPAPLDVRGIPVISVRPLVPEVVGFFRPRTPWRIHILDLPSVGVPWDFAELEAYVRHEARHVWHHDHGVDGTTPEADADAEQFARRTA